MIDWTNLSNIRQSFGNVVYTHVIHEVCAEEASKKACWIARIKFGLMSCSILLLYFGKSENNFIKIIGGILGAVGMGFSLFQLIFPYEKTQQAHKKTALNLLSIRNKYISLMSDLINGVDDEKITKERDKLNDMLDIIYQHAPQTSRSAFNKAQKRLRKDSTVTDGEDRTFSEEEIDWFLTKDLKISTLNSKFSH